LGRLKVWDEDSGQLHRELVALEAELTALVSYLSSDRQHARLVAVCRDLCVYDPEEGVILHRLLGHTEFVHQVVCLDSSSAAPHHPRIVSASWDGTVKVWDGETGERLADLDATTKVYSVAVWKERASGHDRIACVGHGGVFRIWDETFTILRDLVIRSSLRRLLGFQSAEGPYLLLILMESDRGIELWDPMEGRVLKEGIGRHCPVTDIHLFESAGGRYVLAFAGSGEPLGSWKTCIEAWEVGEAPIRAEALRAAHKQG
jgi:WD40 repeat protein